MEGYLLSGLPEEMFIYAPNGAKRLSTALLSELTELILAYRERPSQW